MASTVPQKRALIYCRVSSEMQRKNGSLEEQEKRCRAYCERLGYPVASIVYEVFDGPQLDRPELQKVLLAARQGKFDVLVADLMDRFSRADEAATYALMYQLQQYGVATELSEVDVNSIEGQIMRAVLMVLAKVEHKKIVSRTQSGRRRRAEAGRLFFARYSLFGYERVEGTNGKYEEYVIDEWSANIVRRIVTEVRSGKPLRQICRGLDHDGVPTPAIYALQKHNLTPPKNKKMSAGWQQAMITRIIYNPSYCGERFTGMFKHMKVKSERDPVTGFVTWKQTQQRRTVGDEGTWVADPQRCPAIVSKDDLLAARARLEQNKLEAKRNSLVARDELALLRAGFAVCGYCERNMIAHHRIRKSGSMTAYYSCDRTTVAKDRGYDSVCPVGSCAIFVDQIDGPTWAYVVRLLTEPQALEEALGRVRGETEQRQAEVEERRKALQAAIDDARGQVENFEASLGHTNNVKVQARIVALIEEQETRITTWETELSQFEVQEIADADADEACASLLMWGRAIERRLHSLSYQEKRDILYGLGIQVKVYRRGHEPRFEVTADFGGIRAGWRGNTLGQPQHSKLMLGQVNVSDDAQDPTEPIAIAMPAESYCETTNL